MGRYGTMDEGVRGIARLNSYCADFVRSGCYNMDSQLTIEQGKCLGVCNVVCECVWVGP